MSEPETEEPVEPVEDDETPEDEGSEDEDTEPEGRCEADVTVGGNLYRCGLQAMHDGQHAFTSVDTGEMLEEGAVPSEADMLSQNKKVAQSAKTYWESVHRNYGDDLGGFELCPCCVGYPPGLIFPKAALPPEKQAALRALLGMPSLENYKRDNNYAPCATCDGLGTVLTGSKVPQQMTARCVDCNGTGFITHDLTRRPAQSPPVLAAVENGGEPVPDEPPAFDPWGREFGHPDYGRLPNYTGAAAG